MKTIRGKIENLIIESKVTGINKTQSFVQSFNINDVQVEITTKESIEAKEGDIVIVAGEDSLNEIFKAYSFKNLN